MTIPSKISTAEMHAVPVTRLRLACIDCARGVAA